MPMEWLINALYGNKLGRKLAPWLFRSARLHRLVERFADTLLSKRLAPYLVKKYAIDMSEAERPVSDYKTLNDFFTRRLKPGARPFVRNERAFLSSADAHLSVRTNLGPDSPITVKGIVFTLSGLLGDRTLAQSFEGGTLLLHRLYVPDCHRLYFPCDGVIESIRKIPGHYYSVTPRPGNHVPHYEVNQRFVTEFLSAAFGRMLFVDVGGFLIGSVRFLAPEQAQVRQGDEKSLYCFGGSTLATLVAPDRLTLLPDIAAVSLEDIEIPVKIGQRIGTVAQAGENER